MKAVFLAVLFPFLFLGQAFAQNTRWDSTASTTVGVGTLVPILAMPGSSVAFFNACTTPSCSPSRATTYTSSIGSTTCPTGAQVVWQLPFNQACTSFADSRGNFGGYFQPGAYEYTVTHGGLTYGPYYFTVGGGSGAGSTTILAVDPWVDPRVPQFGASCANNAAIDDSTAITNALLVAQASGLEVQISGTCYIQHPIIWPSTALANDRGFGMRGASTGGTIRAASSFPNTGTASALIYRPYSSNGPASPVKLHDIALDANSTASACVTFEAQRQLFVDNVACYSATGNGAGEMNFGIAAGGSALVGLTARDINIDNYAIIAARGAAARPSYGFYMFGNASDGHIDNVVANQNAVAGIYVNSDNNDFTKLHPWGYSPLQVPTATWPQYGVYIGPNAFSNWFNATQCDTVQTSCFFASHGFMTALNTDLECNDGGTGSACGDFIVTAASGSSSIHLYGGRLFAGSLSPTGSPINWLGSVDSNSDWLVQWPVQKIGIGTSLENGALNLKGTTHLWHVQVDNSTGNWQVIDDATGKVVMQVTPGSPVNAISIGPSSISMSEGLNISGFLSSVGSMVVAGAGNQTMQANSSDANGFANWKVSNSTNGWLGQVNGSSGDWDLLDTSTSSRVFTVAEGAPTHSLLVDNSGNVSVAVGANVVFRCTSAGAVIPAGTLTITAADCGASVDTGLRVK